ncbi:unnamed protein product [Nesidiocoris tenuis]|uniref:Uncharacterized protein n=1 Tax=Nesidiocoris tenuis TaxID=355587 RepID=A0A6H5GGR4_9HEMI|nr:unnamed protein product [Nesidiocoris tenuis]
MALDVVLPSSVHERPPSKEEADGTMLDGKGHQEKRSSVWTSSPSTQDLVHSRAAGVGCTVLTREIGISPSRIQNRTVAVETDREKSIDDHIGPVVSLNNIIGSPRLPPKTSDASVMTDANFTATEKKPVPKERVERRSKGVSTDVGMHDFVTVKEMSKKLKEIQIECAPPPKPHKVSIRVNTHLVHDQIFTQDELDEQVSRFAKTYESNFLSTNLAKKANLISVGVQVANKLEKKHIGLQTATKVHDIGVLAKPNCSVASLQVSPVTKSVGVSNHTTSLDPCERCHVKKTSIGTLFPDRSELLLQRIRSSPEMTVAKRKTISRSTDTRELINTKDVSLNTGQKKLVSTAVVTGDYSCNRCSSSHETKAPPLTSRPSGIPTPAKRPSYLPISVHRIPCGNKSGIAKSLTDHQGITKRYSDRVARTSPSSRRPSAGSPPSWRHREEPGRARAEAFVTLNACSAVCRAPGRLSLGWREVAVPRLVSHLVQTGRPRRKRESALSFTFISVLFTQNTIWLAFCCRGDGTTRQVSAQTTSDAMATNTGSPSEVQASFSTKVRIVIVDQMMERIPSIKMWIHEVNRIHSWSAHLSVLKIMSGWNNCIGNRDGSWESGHRCATLCSRTLLKGKFTLHVIEAQTFKKYYANVEIIETHDAITFFTQERFRIRVRLWLSNSTRSHVFSVIQPFYLGPMIKYI